MKLWPSSEKLLGAIQSGIVIFSTKIANVYNVLDMVILNQISIF